MHSPLYDLATPSSAGTEPGILAAERKPMMPSIAARPLLISVTFGRVRARVGSLRFGLGLVSVRFRFRFGFGLARGPGSGSRSGSG